MSCTALDIAFWEFGKDVIAVAPDGVPCAFQLKGNPGKRLGLK